MCLPVHRDTLLLGKTHIRSVSGKLHFPSAPSPRPLRVPGPLTACSRVLPVISQCPGVWWGCAPITLHRNKEHSHPPTLQLGRGYFRLHLPQGKINSQCPYLHVGRLSQGTDLSRHPQHSSDSVRSTCHQTQQTTLRLQALLCARLWGLARANTSRCDPT